MKNGVETEAPALRVLITVASNEYGKKEIKDSG
jgi:hypothetical protein